MEGYCRTFPYDKKMMLNVLYDILDTLGFKVEEADSERGKIVAIFNQEEALRFKITCNSIAPLKNGTIIRVEPEIKDERRSSLALVLLDEIAALVKNTFVFHSYSQLSK